MVTVSPFGILARMGPEVEGAPRRLSVPLCNMTTPSRDGRGESSGRPKYSVTESDRLRAMASRLFSTQSASSVLSW